jgi:hypothetical protein
VPDTRAALEELFKNAVWDNLVAAGLSALFLELPWLAVWPLGPVIRVITKTFSDKLFAALQLLVDLQAITFQNTASKKAFENEAVKLKIIAMDKGINSPEFQKAKEDAKIALSKMVRFDVAA